MPSTIAMVDIIFKGNKGFDQHVWSCNGKCFDPQEKKQVEVVVSQLQKSLPTCQCSVRSAPLHPEIHNSQHSA